MVSFRPASSCTGFDLHPDQCRVVDVHTHVRDRASGDVRVNAFVLLAEGRMSPALSPELTRLRHDRHFTPDAWVIIWGLPSPDVVAESEIVRQIQPLVDAGFSVRGVCTPAMALAAIARRHARRTPERAAAYVALESNAMCLAIVRDGVLLSSREIAWEFAESAEVVRERLVDELRRWLLFFRQSFRAVVERVVLCGGMPNLRALTASVGSALNVPVETLDSLSGIDAEVVPEPADMFRATVAALWPAIAIASQSGEPPNLLPAGTRPRPETRTRIAPVAAGVAAGALIISAWYFFPGMGRERRAPVQPASPQVTPSPSPLPSPPPSRDANIADAPMKPGPAEVRAQPDLAVSSILYSSQRRLAIVNGRIVRIGDRVGSSTILYIEPRAVVVQSDDGTKRTLEMRRR